MRFVFIAAEKAKYPVRLLCELLEVSQRLLRVDRAARGAEEDLGRATGSRDQGRDGARTRCVRQPARAA
jgi:hypothetical protein